MNDGEKRYSLWTVETLKLHYDALRDADARFQAERDRRYTVQDEARATALEAALRSIEKATDLLASAYRSDKAAQNEWRGTINDIMSKMSGKDTGATDLWKIIASVIGVAVTVGSVLYAVLKP